MSPGDGHRALRYLGDPGPVTVEHDAAGRICAVVIAGRRRSIEIERDDWIVQDRWWTDVPIERRYHELVLVGGRMMTVYRELTTGAWFGYGPGCGSQCPLGRYSTPIDQRPVTASPGRIVRSPSPELNASGAQVMGSTARAVRRRSGASVSPVKTIT